MCRDFRFRSILFRRQLPSVSFARATADIRERRNREDRRGEGSTERHPQDKKSSRAVLGGDRSSLVSPCTVAECPVGPIERKNERVRERETEKRRNKRKS